MVGMTPHPHPNLPPLPEVLRDCGALVLERGWLSSNSVLFPWDPSPLLIDTGYSSHAQQTLSLVQQHLSGQALQRVYNTHLHSDHCGGNAALQARYPNLRTVIPANEAQWIADWCEERLSFAATGQHCPRFGYTDTHAPGDTFVVHGLRWQVHAAPGHDPNSAVFFQADHRLLISADALWEHGFGVVFPELDGERAFDAVAATLDVIERLNPIWVIPGHGRPFSGVAEALARARLRLAKFVSDPSYHERHALKVLLKFKLLDWQTIDWNNLARWCANTPFLCQRISAHTAAGGSAEQWLESLVADLCRSGAARLDNGQLIDQ
jgi:glyoxylase-like metal-dependent hydrolase (beta-lactamase superfamily II)